MAEAMDIQPAETSSKSNAESKPMTYSEQQWLYVKKLSSKNRPWSQNERLRKLLLPKNSIVALTELLRESGDEVASFTVTPYEQSANKTMYCATLTVNGFTVEGYGESKNMSKKSAAEKAIKKIYSKRLAQYMKAEEEIKLRIEKREQKQKERENMMMEEPTEMDAADEDSGAGSSANDGDEDSAEPQEPGSSRVERVTLPMVQLASFALYKLFCSWEMEGHIVPNFQSPTILRYTSKGKDRPLKKNKATKRAQLPVNATELNPGFLLHRMLPGIEYKDLAIEGQKSPLTFVVGVEAEGKSFVGRGHSKKEARRQAAAAACLDLYQVVFEPNADSNEPICAEDATTRKRAKTRKQLEHETDVTVE